MPPLIPIIIGAALAASGVGGIILGGLTALTIGITGLGASLILGGLGRLMLPKPPSLAAFIQEARGRTITARQAVSPWRVILGKIRVGGVITFLHVTGTNKEFLHMVITISGHEVEEIGLMYFDGVLVPVDGSGDATGFFLNHVHREINLGTDTQAAFPGLVADAPTKWTANHRQLGRAGVYVRLKFNPDKFPGSIPNITFDVKGKLLYDPRTEETIVGAPTGADRTANVVTITTAAAHGFAVNDRARVDGVTDNSFNGDFDIDSVLTATTFTYAQTGPNGNSGSGTAGLVAWSENAALCFSEYLLDTDYGVGVALPKIDKSAWIAAANLAEEQVALNAGGFEDRYTCNGSFLVSERPREIMLAVLTAMGGTAVYSGGFWFIYGAAFRTPTLSFDEGDLRGPLRVQSRTGRGQLFNAVKGLYVSAANNWQPSDFPPVTNATFESEDGGKRIYRDIELPYTISAATAQRLAKIELERARRQKTVEVRFGPTALQAQPPDVIQLSVARFGWTNKTFEVLNEKLMLEQDEDGTPRPEITLTLRETDVNVYGFTAEDAPPSAPGDPDLPDLSVAAPPTGLSLATVAILRGDGIRVTFLHPTWIAPADEFVTAGGMIEIEYKKSSSGTWLPFAPVPGAETEAFIGNVDDNTDYDLRIRSVNLALAKSAFVQQLNFTVTAPASDYGAGASFHLRGVYVPDQLNGSANVGEIDFDPVAAGGDYFIVHPDGTFIEVTNANRSRMSQACLESDTGRRYIIFSKDLVNSQRGLAAFQDSHILVVRWNEGSLQYDNNSAFVAFTGRDTDIVIFEVDRSGTGWAGKDTRFIGGSLGAHIQVRERVEVAIDDAGNLIFKNIQNASGVTSGPTTTSSTFATLPEMSKTFTSKGNDVMLIIDGPFGAIGGSSADLELRFVRDSTVIGKTIQITIIPATPLFVTFVRVDTGASAASHTWEVEWRRSSGDSTLVARSTLREIQAVELG